MLTARDLIVYTSIHERGVNMEARKDLTEKYVGLRNKKEQIEADLALVKEEIGLVEGQLLLAMENESLSSFADERFGTIYIRDEVRASEEDQEKLFSWLKENKLEDLIKTSVHSKTLSALAKEHPDIPGVKVFIQTKLGIRRK